MCFEIHPRYPKPQIANEDIVCFKSGVRRNPSWYGTRPVFTSLFQGHVYVLQERQPEVELKPKGNHISEGYHSYTPDHTIVGLPRDSFSYLTLVKCIIPKGSTYYHNPITHEYVSSCLVVLEIVH